MNRFSENLRFEHVLAASITIALWAVVYKYVLHGQLTQDNSIAYALFFDIILMLISLLLLLHYIFWRRDQASVVDIIYFGLALSWIPYFHVRISADTWDLGSKHDLMQLLQRFLSG